jgi:hypothetical protein
MFPSNPVHINLYIAAHIGLMLQRGLAIIRVLNRGSPIAVALDNAVACDWLQSHMVTHLSRSHIAAWLECRKSFGH